MERKFDDANRGALFNNQDRKRDEKDRDYGGKILVECSACGEHVGYWLSGWLKTGKRSGERFLSLAAQAMDKKKVVRGNGAAGRPKPDAVADGELNDEIPF